MKRTQSAQAIRDVLPVLMFLRSEAAKGSIDRIALSIAIREIRERLRYLEKMAKRARARR